MDLTATLTDLQNWLTSLYQSAGYAVVFASCALGNMIIVGFFLPGGAFAALAGFFAHRGLLNLGGVFLAVWAGMVTGYNIDYLIGRLIVSRVLDRWCQTRWGRRIKLEERLHRSVAILDKHGDKAIFYAYATFGHFRSLVAVSIGLARLRYLRFLAYQIIASFLWSVIYVTLGYLISASTENLSGISQQIGLTAAGIFLAIYVLWGLWSALTGEFYDPLIGRISLRRARKRPQKPPAANNG